MRRLGALLSLSFFLLLAAGCGGYLSSAQRAYNDGRYLEAAEKLGDHEDEVAQLSPRGKVSYGLYYGLSLMMLGDLDNAERWLLFAEGVEAQKPGTLRADERAEISAARTRIAKISSEEPALAKQPTSPTLEGAANAGGATPPSPLRTVRETSP
jgi:hypothetical protein